MLKYILCCTAIAISWVNLEFPRPPIVKLMWTERFEGENLSLCFSPLIMILRGSKMKEDPGGRRGEQQERVGFGLSSAACLHACVLHRCSAVAECLGSECDGLGLNPTADN